MEKQYYTTKNTKLAIALATMGIPFHDEVPMVCIREANAIQTTWNFAEKGMWSNLDGSQTAAISARDVGAAWVHPQRSTLPKAALEELMVIRRSLENRQLLMSAVKSDRTEVAYVAQAVRENRNTMERMMQERSIAKLKTNLGHLYVPEQNAEDHAHRYEKALGIRIA